MELLKGSLKTFLNAMTAPDKTMYPVASQNRRDFDNLCDVYLDAVLHPRILDPDAGSRTFQQAGSVGSEAWDPMRGIRCVGSGAWDPMRGIRCVGSDA